MSGMRNRCRNLAIQRLVRSVMMLIGAVPGRIMFALVELFGRFGFGVALYKGKARQEK